jgi:hypothetical protein
VSRSRNRFRLDPAMVAAAHSIIARVHRHLSADFPEGNYLRDPQYVCYFKPLLRIAEEFTRWRTDGIRPLDWRRWRAERDEAFSGLCIRMALGARGPYSGSDARVAGVQWEYDDSPGRHYELVIIGSAAWAIARRAPGGLVEEGELEGPGGHPEPVSGPLQGALVTTVPDPHI